ncbi:hypothetical protein [Bradyrhizobium iriomotense]|uniref:hypothetical protein n=1 Tax=Bradyrhizobium iriomotense TaxID=441950 RepID=UPI001B8A0E4C|nr:hypothetical protein [Bradyrhizobium iriomotense]MBR0786385.1 hypothetical protein [Bradyrhizobium iriomotense]
MMRLTLAMAPSSPRIRFLFQAEWRKARPPKAANMDFLFIDFALRRSEYGSNDCR